MNRSFAYDSALPAPSSQSGPIGRYLCDEMLKGLGRWLRAAGHDTETAANSAPDREVLAKALDEGRLLLTRDVKLAEHRRADEAVVVLSGNALWTCAREAGERLEIDWLARPFSRCLICNTLLQPAPAARAQTKRGELKGKVESIHLCPECDRLYWAGGHVRRMRKRLEDWQKGLFH